MGAAILDRVKITLALALIRLLSHLPLRLLYVVAIPIGMLVWHLPWRKHRIIDCNLALAFPELDRQARRALHRRHLVEMIRLLLESGAVWYWSAKRLENHVQEVNGWEHVTAAQAEGRGVLVVSAHLGNWEILNLYGTMKLPFACLYRAPSNERVNRLITNSRQRFGGQLIASGGPAMRGLLKSLRQGQGAGLMVDQQPKQGEGVFVPFFDTPALTMSLANRLARKTGCQVVLASTRRLEGGRGWALDFVPADQRIASEDPVIAMQAVHEWLEARIRQAPAQYLWSYKRFDLRPDGQPSLYLEKR
jgi:Kdo2-lipid IVA lauroyltransferase/acyltransferase